MLRNQIYLFLEVKKLNVFFQDLGSQGGRLIRSPCTLIISFINLSNLLSA